MGNDQSKKDHSKTATTSQSPGTSTGGGIASSFSFLAKRTSVKSIVVVNSLPLANLNEDEDLKRIREIPRFMPILRGTLSHHQQPLNIFSKVDPVNINKFLQSLQVHLSNSSQSISTAQGEILTQIIQVNKLVGTLMRQASLKQKRLEHITTELGKIGVITSQISDICMTIHTVVIPELDALNERIPDAHRLPPVVQFLPASLSLDVGTKNSSNSNDHMILPAHELVVIDKS